jgi:hypothetical protein
MVKKEKMNTGTLMMVGLVVLLIFIAGAQSFQLLSLKKQMNTELAEIKDLKQSSSPGVTSSASLRNNINNLPSMVGGC